MRDFTQGNVLKQAIFFALPLLAGNYLQFFYGIVNMIVVGRVLGLRGLAAISGTMPIFFFLTSFLVGIGIASNILAAQAYGLKDMKLIRRILPNAWLTSMIIGIVVSAVAISLRDPILDWVNTPADIRPQARLYFTIMSGGLVLQFSYNWLAGTLRGLGDGKTPLYILICCTILNIGLVSYFIIFLNSGVAGAAAGTLLSFLISLLIGYLHTIKRHEIFNIKQWDFALDRQIIRQMVVIGVPGGLQMMVAYLANTVVISIVNRFGSEVTAAYGIGNQVDGIALLPAMTLGVVVSAMAGQNLSLGQYGRVKQIFKTVTMIALLIGALSCLFIFLWPHLIASLFTTNAVVSGYAVQYFRIVCFSYIAMALLSALQGVVRGAGDTVMMLALSVIALILVRVPLAYGLSQTAWRERGVWLAILVSSVAGVLFSYLYYLSGRWKRIKVLPASATGADIEEPGPT